MCAAYLSLIGSKYPEEIKNKLLMKLNVEGLYYYAYLFCFNYYFKSPLGH